MVRVTLESALLEDGIDTVNFFNGRVLTAEDLRDEQRADTTHHRRLGRAIGPGVVTGLEVAAGADRSSVTVTPGLALNARGDALELVAPGAEVALVVAADEGDDTGTCGASPFAPCESKPATAVVSG